MNFFQSIMGLVWKLLQTPFTLYGYTFSFMNVIYLILATAIVAVIFRKIFSV